MGEDSTEKEESGQRSGGKEEGRKRERNGHGGKRRNREEEGNEREGECVYRPGTVYKVDRGIIMFARLCNALAFQIDSSGH